MVQLFSVERGKTGQNGNGHSQDERQAEVLLLLSGLFHWPLLCWFEEPVCQVEHNSKIYVQDILLVDEVGQVGADGGRDRRDGSQNQRFLPLDVAAPGKAKCSEEGCQAR